jgi:DNA invertase Pin-like site-specific DNA recombinase
MKRVGLYLRVSTDEQTIENQTRELAEAAARHGWNVVAEYSDEGMSGSKGRSKRPGLDRLLKAVTRREIDLVAAWSVDRLGRSLGHLVALLGDLIYLRGVGLAQLDSEARAAEAAEVARNTAHKRPQKLYPC